MRPTLLFTLMLVACRTVPVDPGPDLARAREASAAATGLDTSGLDPWAPAADTAQLDLGGLTLVEVQAFALRHDPTLQAALLEIGIAHADWVQAQRLTNPAFNLLARLPSGGGRALLELAVGANLLELWRVPLREERELHLVRAAVLRAARRASELSADVRDAYQGLRRARQESALAEQELSMAQATHAAVLELRRGGAADALDEVRAEGWLLEARVGARGAARTEARAERALTAHLALEHPPTGLVLADPPLAAPARTPEAEALVARALETRPDLVALRELSLALAAGLRVADAQSAGDLAIGPALERQEVDPDLAGVAVTWDPPLFDDGDARRAAASLRADQAERLWRAARVQVARDVRDAASDLAAIRLEVERHQEQSLPLAERGLALARAAFDGGLVELGVLIEAQRALLAARREHLRLRSQLASALVALERALGAPLEEG